MKSIMFCILYLLVGFSRFASLQFYGRIGLIESLLLCLFHYYMIMTICATCKYYLKAIIVSSNFPSIYDNLVSSEYQNEPKF